MKLITICIPLFNEQENLKAVHHALTELATHYEHRYHFEYLFVNDGSQDDSLGVIKGLSASDNRVKYVDLARNFGKETAMLAGFDYAKGDAIIMMDADLQHPTSAIPEMIKGWEEGYQDIYGKRVTREGETVFKKMTSKLYYKLLGMSSTVPVLPSVGDFRLLDRKCIDSIKQLRETQRYTKGLYMWIGYKKKEVTFVANERHAGETKWKLKSLIRLAVDGFISNSTLPLRASLYLGVIIAICSFAYMLYMLISTIVSGNPTPGFPTLTILILFLSGTQLIFLGIMGEYIGKIFMEVKNRPPYLIQEYFDQDEEVKNE